MKDQEAALCQAGRLVRELFPQALGAVLGGSAALGRSTPTSDLDIGILLPDRAGSGREVIRHEGRLVELFLNSIDDVPEFFEWDRARRRATVVFVYAQGMTLTDPHGQVARTRQRAQEVLATGPPPLTAEQWRHGRYVLTCYLDDLADTAIPPVNRYEQLVIADHVLREAVELLTAHHGAWTGIGKWMPRRLIAADPVRGNALLAGHQAVAERADPGPLSARGGRTAGTGGRATARGVCPPLAGAADRGSAVGAPAAGAHHARCGRPRSLCRRAGLPRRPCPLSPAAGHTSRTAAPS